MERTRAIAAGLVQLLLSKIKRMTSHLKHKLKYRTGLSFHRVIGFMCRHREERVRVRVRERERERIMEAPIICRFYGLSGFILKTTNPVQIKKQIKNTVSLSHRPNSSRAAL